MRELPVIACSLDEAGPAARVGEFRALLADAQDLERTQEGARFRLPAARAGEVRALLAEEQECCAFWEFTVTERDDAVMVEARAPAEAAPLVDRLFIER